MEEGAKAATIKRLYDFRSALLLLDFQDDRYDKPAFEKPFNVTTFGGGGGVRYLTRLASPCVQLD